MIGDHRRDDFDVHRTHTMSPDFAIPAFLAIVYFQ
jgi:hypothetical protein